MMNRASMSSGIGAYAPRYMQTGGEANMTSGLDAAQGSASTLTPEQIAAINAMSGITGSAGRGAAAGFQGGANTQALPDYLSFDGNLVSIAPTATNLQFVNLLNDLGLFSDEKSDGLTDYEWFVKATQDNPDANWMSQLFNDPNRDFVVDADFASRSNYSETNLERFRRLSSLINPASQSGGVFQAPLSFVQKYQGGLGLTANRGDGNVARPRQVFIGQRPTGLGLDPNTGQPSAQQPYYTQSDVLVDSTEQPNLYTYNISPATGIGQFDPMNVTAPVNPYDTAATQLSTSYTAPAPSVDSTVSNEPFTSNVQFQDIFADVVTPDKVREFYRMYLGRDPGPNQYVMQFVNSGKTLSQIEQEVMNSPEAQNFAITGTPVSSAEELAQITSARAAAANTVTPDKVRGFYRQHLGRDPGPNEFVMGWVNSGMSLQQIEDAIIASPEGQNFLGNNVVTTEPANTEPANTTPQTVVDTSNITSTATNVGDVPVGETGLTSTQAAILAMEEQAAAEAAAEAAAANTTTPPTTNTVGLSTPAVAGVTLTTDGVVLNNPAASTTSDPNAGRMSFEDFRKLNAGFASGGIVELSGDMNLQANSGQGLESFLQSRSKAALRRNLARTAPRPTAPVMQQGIMPMAR